MTITQIDQEELAKPTSSEEELSHIVCHCTKQNIAWCGLDVSDTPFIPDPLDLDDVKACVFCVLTVEISPHTCPWGCACDICGFPQD